MIFSFSADLMSGNSIFSISFEERSSIYSSEDIFIGCEVVDDYLFAMSVSNGLKSYDISNRDLPQFQDDIDEVCYSHHFDIQDNLFFLVHNKHRELLQVY